MSVSECWIWKRGKNKHGYGKIQVGGKAWLVHRLVFHIFNGPLFNHEIVCHRCDNPSCWNPKHLFKGTQKDNVRDMFIKHRNAPQYGDFHKQRKINSTQVQEIRARWKNRELNQFQLAEMFGVTQSNISRIVRGNIWTKI